MATVHFILEGTAGVGKSYLPTLRTYHQLQKETCFNLLKRFILESLKDVPLFKLYNNLKRINRVTVKFSTFRRQVRRWKKEQAKLQAIVPQTGENIWQ